MISRVIEEFHSQVRFLLESGLMSRHNYFKQLQNHGKTELTTQNPSDLSISLKEIPYSDMYNAIVSHNNYHIQFADSGLLQMNYLFDECDNLIKHRLAYFPTPNEALPQDFNLDEEDVLISELFKASRVFVPVRIDFDPTQWKEINHAKTHLTLGGYKNCRIPVSEPLGPKSFIQFVLSSFYNVEKVPPKERFVKFPRSVSENEEEYLKLELGSCC